MHAFGRDLRPAARRRAEIDHPRALLQEARLVVDFHQLEGGARAHAFALGARYIRIVELALQPQLGRQLAALAGLDPNFKIARAAGLAAHRHDAAA
jgi:hypothetical protein